VIHGGSVGQGKRFGLLAATAAATALIPSSAFGANSVSQTGSPDVVKKGNDVTYTVTVTNTGSSVEDETNVALLTLKAGGERPADNPYKSVVPSQGSCQIASSGSSFGDYHSASCPLGSLAPGASAQITAISTVNEGADHDATLVGCFGSGFSCGPVFGSPNSAIARTLVDAPPVIEGSKKIKVKGLPAGCADRDFKLTATAKGAKKVTGAYSGPRTEEGGPALDEDFEQRSLKTGKGAKLSATIPAGRLSAGYYEIKLAAKYENGPKQKTTIFMQRCGLAPV
jgi:hypothetical protein